MMKSWKALIAMSVVSLSQVACSNSQFLKGMNISVNERNQESYVDLTAEVNLGNASLASLTIPVYDPKTNLEIGQVSFAQAQSGNAIITVSVNATSVAHADPNLGLTLPNQLPIPASLGVGSGSLLAFPVLESSRVYIGGDLKTSIVIGAALGIKGLDSVTGSIGIPGNIFFSQNFSANFFGMAGIYASPNANQNGIAVFGRYTPPVTPSSGVVPTVLALSAKSGSVESPVIPISVSGLARANGNEVINEQVNEAQQKKLLNYFYGKKRVLRPH